MIKLLKRLFRIERYFLVFFSFHEKDGSKGVGHRVFKTDGCYININNCISLMKCEHTDFKVISFINIIELSSREYSELRR